ncbi:PREDICTED: ATP-binding cassette sub-family A member 8 isoform X2 [Chrysochloris asiatica]|uniref:ATP-binding cassette sub-family A member 8 isoform X2 n=1 Tax=Chrysochloris asiatica TaxID=185453 RepID=A0A9B0U111_CHRAS|nr:PREDICTED: ATP-binding cassette sub-family A member 8 isoform X2 [Chrysochloris asiatica]
MSKREISVIQQTWALLCKNLLKKRRMKRDSLMEWLNSLILLLSLYLFPNAHHETDFSSMPTVDLGRVDSLQDSDFIIAYTPITNTTQEIMNKVASAPFLTGGKVIGLLDEEDTEEIEAVYSNEIVKVIFTNTFSYHLKFLFGHRIPISKEHGEHTAHCYEANGNLDCGVSDFWSKGFVALQASINAAIIEITTNHSVMEELMSATGKIMKIYPFISQGGLLTDFFIFFCIISFSPFTYYASLNITRERKKMKSFMKMMGLRDSAFWLSWGLLYAAYVFIMALFMALIIKSSQFVILTGFVVVLTFFLLYGLSLIALTFLTSVLVKKPFLTGLIVFLLTVLWGSVGFAALYRHLPASLEWTLSIFSPFAFTLGMAQLLREDYDLNSNAFSGSEDSSNLIIATHFMLVFDMFLYLALMIYFEYILPNEYGHRRSPLFFLKSSPCSQQQKAAHMTLEDEVDSNPSSNDSFEPVCTEFHGKEAIRIRNVTKEYKGKSENIEALKDLTLDIYEGQITAILGHSGAGKSTLLNILSGLSVPTKGSVTIYNNTYSEMIDLENISKLTGVCLQSNVQFDFLTVKENLSLFAKIRGILPREVDEEVKRILMELEMKNIQDVLVQNLSGGQKRKLSFGIAILGDPQIFILDEPTAGLDPFSRHRVWNFLKERKKDRVILFSTQFMDEADILADRKVFLSKGKLKCAGSSLFLKKKWGIGYHLSLQLNEMCVQEKITALVKQHIPEAKLSAESEGKLMYTLPLERTNKFPDLYKALDSTPDLGIENYGVSMTTLNEVFLKLEGKSAIDESDVGIWGEVQAEGDTESFFAMERVLSSLNEMKNTITGMALWGKQVCAIARVRFLKLKHERRAILSLLLILAVGFSPLLLEYIILKIYQSNYIWELSPHTYFLSPGQQPRDPLTRLLIINKTGTSIDDFIHSVKRQNIALEVDAFGTRDGTEDPSYNGAIIMSGNPMKYNFSLACNAKRLNCFPVLMDIVSNGLLGMFQPSAHVQTDRSTFFVEEQDNPFALLSHTVFWMILAASCSPYIAMSSIDDYKNKVRSQLRISGLFPSAYWFGQALVDVPLYCLMFLSMYLMDYIVTSQDSIFKIINQIMQIPCALGYAASLIFLTYIISFVSRNGRKNSGIWSFAFHIIIMFSIVIFLLGGTGSSGLFCITFLIPPATLIGCIFLSVHLFTNAMFMGNSSGVEAFLLFLIPFLHFIVFLVILRCLEWKFGKKTMRKDPVFSNDVCPNPEVPEGEDEDVQMERVRTANALNSTNFDEKPVIIANCLRKEYAGKRTRCFSRKKKKIATRNVSFCVRKGEVLGLLGHNGAGKSTSIKVITGDTQPTAGQVLLQSISGEDTRGFLGYCPQENALWPNLTVKEHLDVYSTVKGLRREDAEVAITRLVDAFKLQDQLKVPVKTLSEGIKRKLCFMLSVLGGPAVVLLDEPSTGMDPEGQQQMWQAIRAAISNTERGALLTTHYMAEAEAVCDRVAIMVSGRLRCIGSIQHLKSKFGKDYLLEMKVKDPSQVEPLHAEILKLFPQAARQDRYSSLMVYKLPMENVRPLSQAFFKLETVKQSFDLEEYSLSQSTLEQVFLELSKEQELDDFDEEIDSSMKWKLLARDDP